MKYCPTCGKELQYDTAEICPACGCRVSGSRSTPGNIGVDKISAFFLIAIFIVLCIIALSLLHVTPALPDEVSLIPAPSAPDTAARDNSLSVVWNTMGDWSGWEHAASWSGDTVGPCTVAGPRIVNGHGEYGTVISLLAGSTESGVWRTFSDPSGRGWNTLTLTGRLSGIDIPKGRWLQIEVNDAIVYRADATEVPPGNGAIFSVPVHFPQSDTVKVRISNGQKPMWGPSVYMEYYSLRMSLEKLAE